MIRALEGVSAATLAWRRNGRLHLTAVVKATFAFVLEGTMRLVEPEPLIGYRADGPCDLVPFRREVDVWLTGHARATTTTAARFFMYRDDAVLLDKTVYLTPTPTGVAPLDGLGPLHARGSLRREGDVFTVPSELDPRELSHAPADQRVAQLEHDEWLGLAMSGGSPVSMRTRLPGARPVARVGRGAAWQDLVLIADSVQIDVDRGRCSVVWRGQHALDDDMALATTRFEAGLTTFSHEPARDPLADGTADLAHGHAPGPALPFGRPGVVPPTVIDGTLDLSAAADFAARRGASTANPFEAASDPLGAMFGGTADLTSEVVAELRTRRVLPFVSAPPTVAAPQSLDAYQRELPAVGVTEQEWSLLSQSFPAIVPPAHVAPAATPLPMAAAPASPAALAALDEPEPLSLAGHFLAAMAWLDAHAPA